MALFKVTPPPLTETGADLLGIWYLQVANTINSLNDYGRYTPRVTAGANVSAIVEVFPANYLRVGDVATVSGSIRVTTTTVGLDTSVTLNLPPVGNSVDRNNLNGTAAIEGTSNLISCGKVEGPTSTTVSIFWQAPTASTNKIYYTYTYSVSI